MLAGVRSAAVFAVLYSVGQSMIALVGPPWAERRPGVNHAINYGVRAFSPCAVGVKML
jgi:hypothetical protein